MDVQSEHITIFLLVSDQQIRGHLQELLKKNEYKPVVVTGLDRLLKRLKATPEAIVFLDGESVSIYGPGIYAKIKARAQRERIVLLCNEPHRGFVKEAMELGAYGCILEPFAEWEVLTIVKHILSDIQPGRRKSARRSKNPP